MMTSAWLCERHSDKVSLLHKWLKVCLLLQAQILQLLDEESLAPRKSHKADDTKACFHRVLPALLAMACAPDRAVRSAALACLQALSTAVKPGSSYADGTLTGTAASLIGHEKTLCNCERGKNEAFADVAACNHDNGIDFKAAVLYRHCCVRIWARLACSICTVPAAFDA